MRGVPRDRRAISAAPVGGQVEPQLLGAAGHDQLQLRRRVEHQPQRDAEPVAQRRRQQPGARGGAHQGERRQVDPHRARRRALADDQIELEILHRRIQHLLDGGLQAVDLVDEQHVARLQVGQDRGQVAGALDHRAGGGAEADAQLARDDLRQRGLAQARRPVQQHVVHRLRPALAAWMKTRRFSRLAFWPTNSARVCGRSDASAASSRPRRGILAVSHAGYAASRAVTAPIPSGCRGAPSSAAPSPRRSRTRSTTGCASTRR